MALYYYGNRITPHITRTPEGYLIAHDVPLARIGEMQYQAAELGTVANGDPNRLVTVARTPEEVFAQAALASFEGKPVTDGHPPEDVTPANAALYGKGHVQNVRRGAGPLADFMLGDLFITDPTMVEKIENAITREVSCGYNCQWSDNADTGVMHQTAIRGNHVAIVPEGRAGKDVAIRDSAPTEEHAPAAADIPTAKETTPVSTTAQKKLTLGQRILRLATLGVMDAKTPEEKQRITDEATDALADCTDTVVMDTADADAPAAPAAGNPDADADGEMIAKALTPIMKALADLAKRLDALEGAKAAPEEDEKPADAAPADEKPADEIGELLEALGEQIEAAGEEAEGDDPIENEESVTVAAEEIGDETKDEVSAPAMDSAASIALLKKLRPAVAKMAPGPEKDAMVATLRDAFLPGSPGNIMAAIQDAQRSSAQRNQSAPLHDVDKQQAVYDGLNPHRRK